jgi:TATA-box binding protein (TBP) (component of TFIID and TFIIIB)
MSDKKDEKNNTEKSELKGDNVDELENAIPDIREEGEEEINKRNFKNIENIANEHEKGDKKEEQKNEQYRHIDEIKTTKYTTKIFQTTKIEYDENIENVENEPKISFVLSTANLNYQFEDLNELVEKMPERAEFQKRGKKKEQVKKNRYFNRIKLFIEKPKKFAFVNKSGKIVCYGAKSIEESKNACIKCASIIKSCGYNIKFKKCDIEIKNISGNFDLNFKINLKKYLHNLKEFSKSNNNFNFEINSKKNQQKLKKSSIFYNEQDIFPGVTLYFKGEESNFFIRTFSSGKAIFGGAKNESQIKEKYKKLKQLLDKCKV